MSSAIAVVAAGAAVIIISAVFKARRRTRHVGRNRQRRTDDTATYVPIYTDTGNSAGWSSNGSDGQGVDQRVSAGDRDENACTTHGDQQGYDSGSDSCASDFGGGDFGGSDSGGGDSGGGGSD